MFFFVNVFCVFFSSAVAFYAFKKGWRAWMWCNIAAAVFNLLVVVTNVYVQFGTDPNEYNYNKDVSTEEKK